MSTDSPENVPHSDDEDILWVGEFCADSAQKFVEALFKASAKDPKKPLIIYINSPGGQVDALTAMIAAIDAVPNKIVTVCMGHASSAGAMLLSYGDTRYVSPMSRIMVHEISGGAIGNVNDVKVDADEMKRLNKIWMKWLAKNCGKDPKKFSKIFSNKKRDNYLSATEAIKFGIADKIGAPKLKTCTKYEVK